jgi:Asp-tRNA(Asn)/Glu-tRNA(Gln) amidotransferase A subunit family amidase
MASALNPYELTATAAARLIANGELTSEALVSSCLSRIEERDSDIGVWAYLNAEVALAQARQRDQTPPRGPLHGIPVGIKDVFATADMPTQYNSPIYEGHQPSRDAASVALLRSAGAVILGKLTTVEFAALGHIPETRNPHDPDRTPGGSSCGSGAAVSAGMVPIATGTQTGGSVIRPASFCGVYGFKPTYGVVKTEGAKPYAPSLDTVGWMARSIDDLQLTAEALGLPLTDQSKTPSIESLTIGLYRTPMWDEAEEETQRAVEAAADMLAEAGAHIKEVDGPVSFAQLNEAQNTIMHGEGRVAFAAEYRANRDQLHPEICGEVENVLGITPDDMTAAYDHIASCRPQFEAAFEGFDAWLTPSVMGEAPVGLDATGEATFNRLWTALHVPCVTLPKFTGPNGLPVGVQLVAPRFRDQELLAVANVINLTRSVA